MHVRVSGVWKAITSMHVRVSGVWKEIPAAHVRVSGAWKEFFSNAAAFGISLTWGNIASYNVGAPSTCSLSMLRSGDVTITSNLSGTPGALDWIDPRTSTVGDAFHFRLTVNSGTAPTGSAVGSWLAGSSNRTWSLTAAAPGPVTCNLTLSVSNDGGSTTLASHTFSMTATQDIGSF